MRKFLLTFFKAYLFTAVIVLAFIWWNTSLQSLFGFFFDLLTSKTGLQFFHGVFFFVLVLWLFAAHFKRVYTKDGSRALLKTFALRFALPLVACILLIRGLVYFNSQESVSYDWDYSIENRSGQSKNLFQQDGKHRGMSTYRLTKSNEGVLSDLVQSNIEWISIFPYLGQRHVSDTEIRGVEEAGIWTARDSALVQSIELAHTKGLHVMLKPHIWVTDGWRSNINFDSQKDWNTWFQNYRKNILHYAMLAEASEAELFCIGTELRSSLGNQTAAWVDLVGEVRNVYSGKLTYAANWDDNLDQDRFWKELDYVGIQAYYPLTKNMSPSVDEIRQGWQGRISTLEGLAKRHDKPILFTEIGYRNDQRATIEPWEWGSVLNILFRKKSDETQRRAYEAMFLELWDQPWFAGLYAWEWSSSDFPIRSKPSQNVIARWYGKSDEF